MVIMALRLYNCGASPLPLLLSTKGSSSSSSSRIRPWKILARSFSSPSLSPSLSALYSTSSSSNLTTHALGTLYESHCLASLETLLPGLSLRRVGGSGDRGVDLRGWLSLDVLESSLLPSPATRRRRELEEEEEVEGKEREERETMRRRVRVVVQCKATNRLKEKKLGPVVLRELEGVMGRIQLMLRSGMDVERDLIEEEQEGEKEEEEERDMVDLSSSSGVGGGGGGSSGTPSVLAILCSSSGFSKQTMLQATNQVEGNVMLVHLPLPEEVRLPLGSVEEEKERGGEMNLDGVGGTNGDGQEHERQVEEYDELGGTAEATSEEGQVEDSISAMTVATPTTPTSRASQPVSILLSSRLRTAGSSRRLASPSPTSTPTRTPTRTDALMGRLSVGTRRSLIEGGGETPFLLWDGVELGRGAE